MTTILVPYDSAMRLGMGFNTYTHALCINDAVQKPGKIPATENDLRDTDEYSPVSQKVTYSSKYVDKVSDVMNSLNISGSLEIKLQSIGAGGQAKASFLDTDKFKQSDLNFLIQVKVVNNKLIADDVTEFVPIENVTPSQFTDVYGDGFISGYVEGGELNGLVSIKLKDRSTARDLQASLKVNAPFAGGAVHAEGEGSLDMKKNESDVEGERTISVAWAGGGDIKAETATDWTIDALKEAAFTFPSKVAQVPQRMYAIVTKYSALRSFQTRSVNGTPLDYENAGVYTSMLLEAYLEYKSIWKEIQLMSWDAEHNLVTLTKASSSTSMQTYATNLKAAYKTAKDAYDIAKAAEDKARSVMKPEDEGAVTKRSRQTLRKPLESNKVEPYAADLFGLDEARTDCRFEMIKIVAEVDAVTFDPKVAIDSERKHMFLSPSIFRMLMPLSSPRVSDPGIKQIGGTAYVDPAGQQLWTGDRSKMHKRFLEALDRHSSMAGSFRYSDTAAGTYIDSGSSFYTSLDYLNRDMARPTGCGIYFQASGGKELPWLLFINMVHGQKPDGGYVVNRVGSAAIGRDFIGSSKDINGRILKVEIGLKKRYPTDQHATVSALRLTDEWGWRAENGTADEWWSDSAPPEYSLRGFWMVMGEVIDRMGVVWGKDPPS